MPNHSRVQIRNLALVVFVPLLCWFLYNSYHKEKKKLESSTAGAKLAERSKRLSDFAKRHDALIGWEANLPKRGDDGSGLFSIDFSRALMGSNGRPVLICARLNDMTEQRGIMSAHFETSWLDDDSSALPSGSPRLLLDLKCSVQQMADLLNRAVARRSRFAVVARIERIMGSQLRLDAQAGSEDDGSELLPDMDTESRVIHAIGMCVDLLRIDDEP